MVSPFKDIDKQVLLETRYDIDFYQNMPIVEQNVNFATELSYTQIHNKLKSQIDSEYNGIDGTLNYVGKTLVFAYSSADERNWEAGGIFGILIVLVFWKV